MEYIQSLDDFGPLIATPRHLDTGNVLKPSNTNFAIPKEPTFNKAAARYGRDRNLFKKESTKETDGKWWPIEWESLRPEFPFKEEGARVLVRPLFENEKVLIDFSKIWHTETMEKKRTNEILEQCGQYLDETHSVEDVSDEDELISMELNKEESMVSSIKSHENEDHIENEASNKLSFVESMEYSIPMEQSGEFFEFIISNVNTDLILNNIDCTSTNKTHMQGSTLQDTSDTNIINTEILQPQLLPKDQFIDESYNVAHNVTIGEEPPVEICIFAKDPKSVNFVIISPVFDDAEIAKAIIEDILRGLNGTDHEYA